MRGLLIQPMKRSSTGWTPPHWSRHALDMPPINLTPDECQSAAQACRIAAVQAERDAATQSNPGVHQIFLTSVERYRALAARFEQVRKSGDSS
jgi:hypothetical protein